MEKMIVNGLTDNITPMDAEKINKMCPTSESLKLGDILNKLEDETQKKIQANNIEEVEVVAQDAIKINDVVYNIPTVNSENDFVFYNYSDNNFEAICPDYYCPANGLLNVYNMNFETGSAYKSYKSYKIKNSGSGLPRAYYLEKFVIENFPVANMEWDTFYFSDSGKYVVVMGANSITHELKTALCKIENDSFIFICELLLNPMLSVYVKFSPNDKTLAVIYSTSRYEENANVELLVYNINDENATLKITMKVDDINPNNISDVIFSPNGDNFLICTSFGINIYNTENYNWSFKTKLIPENSYTYDRIFFSPNNRLIATKYNENYYIGDVFNIIDKEYMYVSSFYSDGEENPFDGAIYNCVFSADGKNLVVQGDFTEKVKLYLMDGSDVNYVDIVNVGSETYTNIIKWVAFNTFSGAEYFMISRMGEDYIPSIRIYQMIEGNLVYIEDMKRMLPQPLEAMVNSAVFSKDGKLLILTGIFSGYAKVYEVKFNNTLSFLSDVYDENMSALSAPPLKAMISNTGKYLLLFFDIETGINNVKIYKIQKNEIIFVSDLKRDGEKILVVDLAFSETDEAMVITSPITDECVSIYSLNEEEIFTFDKVLPLSSDTFPLVKAMKLNENDSESRIFVYRISEETQVELYTWGGEKLDQTPTQFGGSSDIAYFPEQKILAVIGVNRDPFNQTVELYKVDRDSFSYLSQLYFKDFVLTDAVSLYNFKNSNLLLVCTLDEDTQDVNFRIYQINEDGANYIQDLPFDSTTSVFPNIVLTSVEARWETPALIKQFGNDKKIAIAYNKMSNTNQTLGVIKIYELMGNTVKYIGDVKSGELENNNFDDTLMDFDISNNQMIAGGRFTNFADNYKYLIKNEGYISPYNFDSKWYKIGVSTSDINKDLKGLVNNYIEVRDNGGNGISLDSPAFTGTPTAPTADSSANNTQIATTAFVKANFKLSYYSIGRLTSQLSVTY